MRFQSHRWYTTPGALAVFSRPECAEELPRILARHFDGDWGEVCDEDREANDRDLVDGGRLLSAYTVGSTKVWIITEAADEDGDRGPTTVLLPEEY